jgi:hypothetical protein
MAKIILVWNLAQPVKASEKNKTNKKNSNNSYL